MAMAGSAMAEGSYGYFDAFVMQHDQRSAANEDGDPGLGAGLGLGFPLHRDAGRMSALEIGGFAAQVDNGNQPSDSQYGLLASWVNTFERGGTDPFISLGVGYIRDDLATAASGANPAVTGGLGFDFSRGGAGTRIGVIAHHILNKEAGGDDYTDLRLTLTILGARAPAPKPVPVAAKPVDTDGDGVVDGTDECPTQPASTPNGCPALAPAEPERDTDADGVPDSKDNCPGTLEGLGVDDSGCTKAKQSIVLKGVTFPSGSSELTADAKAVLDTAHEALAGQPDLKVEIGGYTDSSGDDKLNLALSQKRADSVRAYLVGKGIAGDRLTAKGYGEANPIADNKTKEGRKENRRVELKTL